VKILTFWNLLLKSVTKVALAVLDPVVCITSKQWRSTKNHMTLILNRLLEVVTQNFI